MNDNSLMVKKAETRQRKYHPHALVRWHLKLWVSGRDVTKLALPDNPSSENELAPEWNESIQNNNKKYKFTAR